MTIELLAAEASLLPAPTPRPGTQARLVCFD